MSAAVSPTEASWRRVRVIDVAARVGVVLASLLALWLMQWNYLQVLVAGYPRVFVNIPHGEDLHLAMFALGALPALWLPVRMRRPSDLFLWGLYAMVYLPTCAASLYSVLDDRGVVGMVLSILAGLLVIQVFSRVPALRLSPPKVSPGLFWIGLGLISLLFYAICVRTFGIQFQLAGLEQMQAQRVAWVQESTSPLVSYAFSWQSSAINVFLIAYGVYTRRWWVVVLGVFGQFFFYAVAAQKIVLSVVGFVLVVYLLVRKGGRFLGWSVSAGVAAIFAIPYLLSLAGQSVAPIYTYLVTYRSFMNNGVLSPLYYFFFAEYGFVNFAEVTGIGRFFHSPYPQGYVAAVSEYFFGFNAGANANLFADGFAQLGYAGVLIQATALGLVVWAVDSLWACKKLPLAFVCMSLGVFISDLSNARVHTTLIGGGMLFAMLLVWLLPNGRKAEDAPEPA